MNALDNGLYKVVTSYDVTECRKQRAVQIPGEKLRGLPQETIAPACTRFMGVLVLPGSL